MRAPLPWEVRRPSKVITELTAISRASCDRGKIEVRGSSTFGGGTAVISDADIAGSALGTANLVLDTVTGNSIYRFREDVGSCPLNIRVESQDDFGSTSFDVAPVDIK